MKDRWFVKYWHRNKWHIWMADKCQKHKRWGHCESILKLKC